MTHIWMSTKNGSPQHIGNTDLASETAESILASARAAGFCVKACLVYRYDGKDTVKVFDHASTMESYIERNKVAGKIDTALAAL